MNERAIRWAWGQNLPSTHKLVLLALAYVADGNGQCSPSISSLAAQCGVSTRTVRRALRDLEADSLLTAEARLRPDGSTTSNQYALWMSGGHMLSPSLDIHVIGPGRWMAGVDDTARPRDMGHTGMATHLSETVGSPPSELAGAQVLRDADRDRPIKQSTGLLAGAAMTGVALDNNASPPSPAGTTPSMSATQAVSANAPTTEKPFAYLRSVIGGGPDKTLTGAVPGRESS